MCLRHRLQSHRPVQVLSFVFQFTLALCIISIIETPSAALLLAFMVARLTQFFCIRIEFIKDQKRWVWRAIMGLAALLQMSIVLSRQVRS